MNNIDISKLVDDFKNRKIHKRLSLKILVTIPDNEIEQAIVDYVNTKLTNPRSMLSDFSNMSSGFQILFSTWVLEGEVNNGGFNQFFFNSSGQLADLALLSLKKLSAAKHYEVLEKAIAIHVQEKESCPLKKLYSMRTLKAFLASYKYSSLDKCDEEFNKLENSLSELRIQYIRAHPDEFIGN